MSTEERVAKIEAVIEGTDRRLANIETDVREIRRDLRGDFRVVFGAIITVAIGLATLMAKGFNWL